MPVLSVYKDPYTKKNTDKIKAIQRRASIIVLSLYHSTSTALAYSL